MSSRFVPYPTALAHLANIYPRNRVDQLAIPANLVNALAKKKVPNQPDALDAKSATPGPCTNQGNEE
jgi:hypothetical protein